MRYGTGVTIGAPSDTRNFYYIRFELETQLCGSFRTELPRRCARNEREELLQIGKSVSTETAIQDDCDDVIVKMWNDSEERGWRSVYVD
jgi:hypothetical protein